MPIFDKLQKAAFNGVVFPVTAVDIQGGIRDHIHEYPHADGGAPEKMGRKLYQIKMEADFQSTFKAYPDLYPNGLIKLRSFFEQQLTADLTIPTIGTMKAYARTWSQKMAPRSSRSGETATFEFIEDQDEQVLVKTLGPTTAALSHGMGTYNAAYLRSIFASEKDISIFDAISNAVNAILAISDLTQAASNLIGAKLLALTNMCASASQSLTAKDMRNAPLIQALHDIWDTAQRAGDTLVSDRAEPRIYVVPTTMSMSSISSNLYGDASHTVELMQLNAVPDPFTVRAGTSITYIRSEKAIPGGRTIL